MIKTMTWGDYKAAKHFDYPQDVMHRSRGDIIRLADTDFFGPGIGEVGLFAVPALASDVNVFLLVDGKGDVIKLPELCTSLTDLVRFIVRTMGDHASLTDIARAVL